MVSSTLCPAVHILGSQNVYGRAEGIADHYWLSYRINFSSTKNIIATTLLPYHYHLQYPDATTTIYQMQIMYFVSKKY